MGGVWVSRGGLVLILAGCATELPGESVGTYRITMQLEENECGEAAVYSSDGHVYSAELRAEAGRGFWRVPEQPPLSGTYDDGAFRFTYASLVATSAPDAGAYCALVQNELLEGNVTSTAADAGTSDASVPDASAARTPTGLEGEHVLTISAASGTDCRDALAPAGAYQKLPCSLRYRITGVSRDPF